MICCCDDYILLLTSFHCLIVFVLSVLYSSVFFSSPQTARDLGLRDGDVIYAMMNQCGAKPVILLYDNEMKVNEEVTTTLTLNDAMNIGATYPSPTTVDERVATEKKYEWKCSYSSDGSDDACALTCEGKKYEYVFWERPCNKNDVFNGEVVGIRKEHFVDELEVLLEKLGLNERESNDFIVYWLTKLSNRKGHRVTICNEHYDNEIAKLQVKGFSQIHRVMLKFEEVIDDVVVILKQVKDVERKQRPTGKYVIEWGAILA